jgi:hypothetical protein
MFLAAALVMTGCNGDRVVALPGGYKWIEHDGESQVITSSGTILFDHVTGARGDGALIRGERENGDSFSIDVRTGGVVR